MNKSLRRAVIAGNWKMNMTPAETTELIAQMKPLVAQAGCSVVICTPYVDLCAALEAAKGSNVEIGAQNCHWAEKGAFTGEVSAKMLAAMQVPYVIVGHSERRTYFGDNDVTVRDRLRAALDEGLCGILCVGETLEQREQGITVDLVRMQVKIALKDVKPEDAKKAVIAYEPIWAIGTGRTATSVQAEEVCGAIRQVVSEIYGTEVAEEIRVQYGGSVNAGNAAELFAMPNIDGGLVGGASLKADFAKIVNY